MDKKRFEIEPIDWQRLAISYAKEALEIGHDEEALSYLMIRIIRCHYNEGCTHEKKNSNRELQALRSSISSTLNTEMGG